MTLPTFTRGPGGLVNTRFQSSTQCSCARRASSAVKRQLRSVSSVAQISQISSEILEGFVQEAFKEPTWVQGCTLARKPAARQASTLPSNDGPALQAKRLCAPCLYRPSGDSVSSPVLPDASSSSMSAIAVSFSSSSRATCTGARRASSARDAIANYRAVNAGLAAPRF